MGSITARAVFGVRGAAVAAWGRVGRVEGGQGFQPFGHVAGNGREVLCPADDGGLVSVETAGQVAHGPTEDQEADQQPAAGHGGRCGGRLRLLSRVPYGPWPGVFTMNTPVPRRAFPLRCRLLPRFRCVVLVRGDGGVDACGAVHAPILTGCGANGMSLARRPWCETGVPPGRPELASRSVPRCRPRRFRPALRPLPRRSTERHADALDRLPALSVARAHPPHSVAGIRGAGALGAAVSWCWNPTWCRNLAPTQHPCHQGPFGARAGVAAPFAPTPRRSTGVTVGSVASATATPSTPTTTPARTPARTCTADRRLHARALA